MQIDASTRVIYHNPAISAARVMATYASASGGWWDNNGAISGCIGAWQAKGAASLAASYTDLSGTGNDLTAGTAPSFATGTGWTFNGSTQYLLTGISISGSSTNYSFIVQYASAPSAYQRLGGYLDAGTPDGLWLTPNRFGERWYVNGGYGNLVSVAHGGADTGGNMCVAGSGCYFDGSSDGTISTATTHDGGEIYLGTGNLAGTPDRYFGGVIIAAAFYNTTLSSGDVSTIATAMAAL